MARIRSTGFPLDAGGYRAEVLAGELPVCSALPGEQVATVFDVDCLTIRKSIRLLKQTGLIARRQGRNTLPITAPLQEDPGTVCSQSAAYTCANEYSPAFCADHPSAV